MHEAQAARQAHASVARLAARVLAGLDGATDEAQARRLARDVALLLQAAQLQAISPPEVFDSFCAARIDEGSDAFGMLGRGAPLRALLQRAWPPMASTT
jgi:putative acyl-CoA dehydrogenase